MGSSLDSFPRFPKELRKSFVSLSRSAHKSFPNFFLLFLDYFLTVHNVNQVTHSPGLVMHILSTEGGLLMREKFHNSAEIV